MVGWGAERGSQEGDGATSGAIAAASRGGGGARLSAALQGAGLSMSTISSSAQRGAASLSAEGHDAFEGGGLVYGLCAVGTE